MVQTSRQLPKNPKQAAKRSSTLDRSLNAELFKALADPTRNQLLACLAKCSRPCSVTEVAACCDIDFSVVSRHLAVLHRAGFLAASKQGRTVFYSVNYREISEKLTALAKAFEQCCGSDSQETCCGKC